MPKTIGNISEQGLKQIPLPTQHSKQYATVSHGYIIDTVKEELENQGYSINTEEYRCTHNGGVAQGIYYINHGDDPELGLMFAWCNSYDKSTRFKCAVGAHVFVCGNGMMIGDMANYNKKHYGDSTKVKGLVKQHIETQIGTASNYYNMIKHDKAAMKVVSLTEEETMGIMGCVFFKDIITINQLSITKKQYEKPSYDYNAPLNSLWAVYNHITYSLKTSHPKNWMDQQAELHSFIVNNYLPKKAVVNPNQMNIVDVIDKEVTPNPLDNLTETVDSPLLGTDDMNSCPEALDNLANEEADMIKNEEIIEEREEEDVFNAIADKVRPEVSEEIIEKTEAEDILGEAENIEESNNDLSFDNYFGEESIDEDADLSDVNEIVSELKKESQEDFDEKADNEEINSDINVVENNSDEGKLELPDFEF